MVVGFRSEVRFEKLLMSSSSGDALLFGISDSEDDDLSGLCECVVAEAASGSSR